MPDDPTPVFPSIAIGDRLFDEADLGVIFAELEAARRAGLGKLIHRAAVTAAAVGALAVSMAFVPAALDLPVLVGIPCLAALLIWAYWARRPLEEFRDAFDDRFIPALAGAFGGIRYDRHGALPLVWMKRSGLIPESVIYSSDHMMSGEQSGIGVQFAQAELMDSSKPGDRRRPGLAQAFGGLFVLLSLPKAFSGRTALLPAPGPVSKMFSAPILMWGNVVGPVLKTSGGRFEVFSTDPEEARSVLSAPLVERLVVLADALGGSNLQLGYYDAQIFLKLTLKKDLFAAPSIFRGIGKSRRRVPVLSEVRVIEEMADLLHRQAMAGN